MRSNFKPTRGDVLQFDGKDVATVVGMSRDKKYLYASKLGTVVAVDPGMVDLLGNPTDDDVQLVWGLKVPLHHAEVVAV